MMQMYFPDYFSVGLYHFQKCLSFNKTLYSNSHKLPIPFFNLFFIPFFFKCALVVVWAYVCVRMLDAQELKL